MIPFKRRGMWQALQNSVFGLGAVVGASFGGAIADSIGWRWCFLLQCPVAIFSLVVGYFVVKDQGHLAVANGESALSIIWSKIDLAGSLVLVIALVMQLIGLSVGGNELPWSSGWVITLLVGSTALILLFVVIESKTKAIPIIPLRMFKRRLSIAIQITNLCAGISAYAVSCIKIVFSVC